MQDDDSIELLQLQQCEQVPSICRFNYCSTCNIVRPPRALHCMGACECCVLKVDHHCVWIGNTCVGFLNHKFFLLYLLYFSLASLILVLPYLRILISEPFGFFDLLIGDPYGFLLFAVSLCLWLATTGMCLMQLGLICNNQTTLEFSNSPRLKPFSQQQLIKNVSAVMGKTKWFNPWIHPFTQDTQTQHQAFIDVITPTISINNCV